MRAQKLDCFHSDWTRPGFFIGLLKVQYFPRGSLDVNRGPFLAMFKSAEALFYSLRTALNSISRASISTKPIGNLGSGWLGTVSYNKRALPYLQFHSGDCTLLLGTVPYTPIVCYLGTVSYNKQALPYNFTVGTVSHTIHRDCMLQVWTVSINKWAHSYLQYHRGLYLRKL